MNNKNRKELRNALDLLEQANSILEQVLGDEQEKFDNMPEGLQESEKGERFQEVIDTLESAQLDLESVRENIEEAIQ